MWKLLIIFFCFTFPLPAFAQKEKTIDEFAAMYDSSRCKDCHDVIYEQWEKSQHARQCYLTLPFPEIKDRSVQLRDFLNSACYNREGNDLSERGLYLDLEPWSYHVFDIVLNP